MNDNLNLWKIFFGMRDEYLENYNKLQELKKYLYISDERVSDYYIGMEKHKGDIDPVVSIVNVDDETLLRFLKDKLVMFFNEDKEKYKYYYGDFGKYIYSKYGLYFLNEVDLEKDLTSILKSGFVKNIDSCVKFGSDESIKFMPQCIDYHNSIYNNDFSVKYMACDDTFNLSKNSDPLIVRAEFCRKKYYDSLDDYHSSIIKNSPKRDYFVELFIDNVYDIKGKYKIEESNKRLMLKRTK